MAHVSKIVGGGGYIKYKIFYMHIKHINKVSLFMLNGIITLIKEDVEKVRKVSWRRQ